jgi:hypothetical protein
MRFEVAWGWGNPCPWIVGSYEAELHPFIERLIASHPDPVIDVGCAEGYYAVGFALRVPDSQVYAFDIDIGAIERCRQNAERNDVADRVHPGGRCGPADLEALCRPGSLVILDCEGAELEVLRPEAAPSLASATVLVELHDCYNPTISGTIRHRFERTHTIELVRAVPRDTSAWPVLECLSPSDRDAAVFERRATTPYPQEWALMTPVTL